MTKTFTFIEFEAANGFDIRVVAVRGGVNCLAQGTRLERFAAARGWSIIAIYEVDKPTLPEAFEWLRECITVYRNPEMPEHLLG